MGSKTVFDVDLQGLAKLLERRGIEWAVLELIQNGWDTETERLDITIEPVPKKSMVKVLVVDEDPEGFKDLAHAWTLFAESAKKSDPELRGRFNLGEKLVLAYSLAYGGEVTIKTTTGTVRFNKDGRKRLRSKTKSGSEVVCTMKATRAQMDEIIQSCQRLIPDIPTYINGEEIPSRDKVGVFMVTLPTEIADEEGILRRTKRKTSVCVYEPREGEIPSIYEMGIPVVETGDKWHYDVGQKVPLNMERDNVTPSYLKTLRVAVMNEMFLAVEKEEATDDWVQQATGDDRCDENAIEVTLNHRFGEKRVAYDPSDPESNKIAMSHGYTVVHGGSMSCGQWENAKISGLISPAGKVCPSPKPYSDEGQPEKVITNWTPDMKRVAEYCKRVGKHLIGAEIGVRIVNEPMVGWTANYGGRELCLNYGRLGHKWFEDQSKRGMEKVNSLLIHEMAHETESDHYSASYLSTICALGAKLATYAATGRMNWHGTTAEAVRGLAKARAESLKRKPTQSEKKLAALAKLKRGKRSKFSGRKTGGVK